VVAMAEVVIDVAISCRNCYFHNFTFFELHKDKILLPTEQKNQKIGRGLLNLKL
jgi:hypothetical protein